MILHPSIIALLVGAALIALLTVYSSAIGFQILRYWDIQSGSERQLQLERKTYLISTSLATALSFNILSLFLFIHTADSLHDLFTGAMCAAGVLLINQYGYPALIVKTISCILCGLWLILNYADNQGYDYPLIKKKYAFLLAIALIIIAESILQLNFFLGLRGDVITSCCGSLFSDEQANVIGDILSFPHKIAMIAFYVSALIVICFGAYYIFTGKGVYWFSALNVVFLFVAVASIISFISIYYYELPTHHCPFCILQKHYHYVGYPLYIFLLSGVITGISAGMLNGFRKIPSLQAVIPEITKKLVITSIVSYAIFIAIATYPVIFSSFTAFGY